MTRGGSLARVKMLVNGNSAKRLNELVLVAATNTEMWTPAVYVGGVFFFHCEEWKAVLYAVIVFRNHKYFLIFLCSCE